MHNYIKFSCLEEELRNNSLWENLLWMDFSGNHARWEKEFMAFETFLDEEIMHVVDAPVSWEVTYVYLKKLLTAASYMVHVFQLNLMIHGHIVHTKEFLTKQMNRFKNLRKRIHLNEAIFDKFKLLPKSLELDHEQNRIFQAWKQYYFQTEYSQEQKSTYYKLVKQLSGYIKEFGANNEEALWSKKHSVYISPLKAHMVEGIPALHLNAARHNASLHHKEGWLFYIQDTFVSYLLSVAKSRVFRQKVYNTYHRLNSAQELLVDNDAVLRNILSTKQKIAQLFDKKNYSELVLSNFILDKPEAVYNYLAKIENELQPLVHNIRQDILQEARLDGIRQVKPWDIPFYYEKIHNRYLKKQKDNFSQYFSYEQVMPKLMKFFEEQFNLTISQQGHPAYKKSNGLQLYKMTDNQSQRHGYFIISPYGGSWVEYSMLECEAMENGYHVPSIQYITLGLHRGRQHTLLSFSDLACLLHEIGHAFHSFFGSIKDALAYNMPISWDVVELPSQFLEHLIYEKNFIINLSSHYKKKEPLSEKILHEVIQYNQFFKGYDVYCEVQKHKAHLWLHQHFKPYSKKNPHQIIEDRLAQEGIIYNIARDEFMSSLEHQQDYGPAGYIYLYSAQLAFQLFEFSIHNDLLKSKQALRLVYEEIFNSEKPVNVSAHLEKFLDMHNVNILKFLQKTWDIKLYGTATWQDKEKNLKKIIFKENHESL